MAKRGRFSGGIRYGGVPMQIINMIKRQSAGENTSNIPETVMPNTSGPVSPKEKNRGPMTPERMTGKLEREQNRQYTAEEIAGNDYLNTLKTALSTMTYEQALANVRKATAASNLSLLAGTKNSAADVWKAQQARAKILSDPFLKYATEIFFKMGGSMQDAPGSKYGGYGVGQVDAATYTKLGLTPPTTQYAPVGTTTQQVGNRIVTTISNPLSDTQKAALQRLRTLNKSGANLTAKQSARLARLKALKNAPTIITE